MSGSPGAAGRAGGSPAEAGGHAGESPAETGGHAGEPELDDVQCRTTRDCFFDNACLQVSCRDFRCLLSPRGSGAPCKAAAGAGVCDGAGACVACLTTADCTAGTCLDQQCMPFSCSNAFKDGDETDVDCGGSCPACIQTPQP